ncbi:MAG: hypothetical protein GEV28_07490 [Actinophytocola sp.]|uniref:hypothetical protein n=1 Tax=Actinophytocola sp. TaxID=1872138 RepID=UPI00132461A5|nr:hypothetical protein [Actinophytocola sp.]MPZ80233.1 hypothetical protein [Actinophytocola sp.]
MALTLWLFGEGIVELVFGLLTALAAVVLVVLAVVGAVVEHQPGRVLVTLAFLGVGLLLTAVVFGFAYLGESLTYVRGEATTARVVSCEEDGAARQGRSHRSGRGGRWGGGSVARARGRRLPEAARSPGDRRGHTWLRRGSHGSTVRWRRCSSCCRSFRCTTTCG